MNKPVWSVRAVRWFFRCAAVGLALAQTIAARNGIDPDGRAYLELAGATLRHDWPMTVNALWQPVYPWLLALTLAISKPSLRWIFPAAHALNFVVFCACIAAFEFFWKFVPETAEKSSKESDALLPAVIWWTLGYSLFIWLTVGWVLPYAKPDLALMVVTLLEAALLLRIEASEPPSWMLMIGFGTLLAIGYLTKAILFPVAFLFLGILLVSSRSRKYWGRIAVAAVFFVIFSTPEITLLSLSKGRLTYADSGHLNLAWHDYGLPFRDWQGERNSGTPVHPTRKIYDHPAVFEFNGPLRASYPPWFDPSYWNEGLSPAFSLRTIAIHAARDLPTLVWVLVQPKYWIACVILLLLGAQARATVVGIARRWDLLLISLAVFAVYCLTSIEPRYFPPWQMLFWAAILSGIHMRPNPNWRLYGPLVAVVAVALLGLTANGIRGQFLQGRHDDGSPDYTTAEGLRKMGVQPGEKVAAIGFDSDAYFAYLDGLSIVAEINTNDTCEFWQDSPSVQSDIMEKLKKAGVQVVVANTGGGVRSTSRKVPIDLAACFRPAAGWQQIEGGRNHVYFLQ